MRWTRVSRWVDAPPARVYAALVDPEAVAKWKAPEGMSCRVHVFEPREGGALRISLTYDLPAGTGKTTARTDTYHGHFVELVPNERVVEIDEFETDDPVLQGEMKVTITVAAAGGGSEVTGLHERLPGGVSKRENEAGWRSALARLAALVEQG